MRMGTGFVLLLASLACGGNSVVGTGAPPGGDTGGDVGSTPAPQPVDPCAGLMPALPAPKTAKVPAWDWDPSACGVPFSDGAGNLYLNGDTITDATGLQMGRAGFFVPIGSGFTAYDLSMAAAGSLRAYGPDGVERASAPMHGYESTGGVQANGGVVGVEADCLVVQKVQVTRIDAEGKLTSTVELDQQCMPFTGTSALKVIDDAQDRTLLVAGGGEAPGTGVAAGKLGARWFDTSGKALTDWFELAGDGGLFPVIGGGVALKSGGDWVATLASGTAELGPAPAGFRSGATAVRALGGKAYAIVPGTAPGSIDVVEPGGKLCGSLVVPDGFTIGGDGSLLYVDPEGRDHDTNLCSVTVYPQVLK